MSAQPDDLTVTTATMSPEEIRQSLGEPTPDEKSTATVTPEQEADDASKPDAALSEAGRTLRMSRADARKAKINDEIAALTRSKHEEAAALENLRRQRADIERQAPAKPAAAKPAPAAADAFAFPSFDQYQAEHPEADYEEYTDVRTDARFAWNQRNAARDQERRDMARQEAEHKQRYDAAQAKFRESHADYDASLETAKLPVTPVTSPLNDGSPAPLYQLIRNTGEKSPQILYYLAKHPEEALILANAPNPSALIYAFAQMEMRATGAVSAPPAAKPTPVPPSPQVPITSASAPLTPVSGVAQHTRTLQSIADEDDDADAYIAARRRELKRTG